MSKRKIVIFSIAAIVAQIIVSTGIALYLRHSINEQISAIMAERNSYADDIDAELETKFEGGFIIKVEHKTDFSFEEVKFTGSDGREKKYYNFHDNLEVYAYVDEGFEKLSKEQILEYGKKNVRTSRDVFSRACSENAPLYSRCVRDNKLPGKYDAVYRTTKTTFYVICGDNTYKFPEGFDYAYYKNGNYIDMLYLDTDTAETKPSSNTGTSGKTYSSGGSSGRNGIFTDPDDYDDPDDYADDAWGVDFDDWDDAYDYWEDW